MAEARGAVHDTFHSNFQTIEALIEPTRSWQVCGALPLMCLTPATIPEAQACCRKGDVKRQWLVELFKVSPHCAPARLMEAELLLAQKDYGGDLQFPSPGLGPLGVA